MVDIAISYQKQFKYRDTKIVGNIPIPKNTDKQLKANTSDKTVKWRTVQGKPPITEPVLPAILVPSIPQPKTAIFIAMVLLLEYNEG